MLRILLIINLSMLSLIFSVSSYAENSKEDIKIGVLSHRGDKATLEAWDATAKYLCAELPDYHFTIEPLNFNQVDDATRKGDVDFILVNPGIYVNLETRYRASRIATMNNYRGSSAYNIFGGVIFTRSDRKDIFVLDDLKGKSFMAVDDTSLGGYQMAWRELNARGIDLKKDLESVEFGGIHDNVVMSVLNGEVDVGTVRTDIIERMAADDEIDINEIKIINSQVRAEFPFALSTRVYPEWPFSKVEHTDNVLAQKVALALLQMSTEHPAALAGNYAGWTIPLDYQRVHDLFRELKLPPYAARGRFTLEEAIAKYWYWVLGTMLILLGMLGITALMIWHNKALEQAKKRLEKQHELILNSVDDGIYGVDLKGRCTFVNKAMEEMTGWSAEDLIGNNQHMILHHTRGDGTHHPPDECPVYATYKDSMPRFIPDDIFWKKDGSHLSVEYNSTPLKGNKGKTTGSVVVFRDTTARKMNEAKSREHKKQLEHVSRLSTLGEMASGIAHELNQPLTAITMNSRACVRMIESGQRDQQSNCSDAMLKIADQAERAGGIIRHIRNFVQKELPDRKPVLVERMVETVTDLMGPEIKQKSILFSVDIDPAVEWVFAQQIQIEQVLINLVRNAVDALEDVDQKSRSLSLSIALHKNKQVEFRVNDSGKGIAKKVAGELFEPFVSSKEKGMGLGLSISQGIISSHGSRLRVDSSTKKGTTFYFFLPVSTNPKTTITEALSNDY